MACVSIKKSNSFLCPNRLACFPSGKKKYGFESNIVCRANVLSINDSIHSITAGSVVRLLRKSDALELIEKFS
jgi:hypothetical protein